MSTKRFDVVGSFLRPENLKKARADFEAGKISAEEEACQNRSWNRTHPAGRSGFPAVPRKDRYPLSSCRPASAGASHSRGRLRSGS